MQQAIFWGANLGDPPTCEILFMKGEEDVDHLVAQIPLPRVVTTQPEAWAIASDMIAAATLEQFAAWKSTAVPIDRDAIAKAERRV